MSRAELEEEQSFIERSLVDLDRELAAGDSEPEQYDGLRGRYSARIAEVKRELEGLPGPEVAAAREPAPGARTSSRSKLSSKRARLVTGWAGFASLTAAVVVLVLAVTHSGPFRQTVSLPVNERVRIELGEAGILGAKGDVSQAIATYDLVLELDPHQVQALENGGWLARLAGLSQHNSALVQSGDDEIQAAVRVDPADAVARAYYAVVLLQDRKDPAAAVAQFRAMLAHHPSATLLWTVRKSAETAFGQAHLPVPPLIAQATKPST